MSRETDLAWLAGMIDGEGSVGVVHTTSGRRRVDGSRFQHSFSAVLNVTNTHLGSLVRCREIGGGLGLLREHREATDTTRQCFRWMVRSNQATKILAEILPYLVIKPEQARLAIRAQGLLSPIGRLGGSGKANPFREELEWICIAIKALNHGEDSPPISLPDNRQPTLFDVLGGS